MKVALFRNMDSGFQSVWDSNARPVSVEWVRVSGWVEVELPPLTAAEHAEVAELVALHKQQKSLEDDYHAKRKALRESREKLAVAS